MSFKDYAQTTKEHLSKLGNYLIGKNSAPTLEVKIDLSKELNALHNVSSSEQLIQLSNAFYDQVAVKRSLSEIYKKPKDYLNEFKTSINDRVSSIDNMVENVDMQHKSVDANKLRSQSARSISNKLQLKLSLIKDNSNA